MSPHSLSPGRGAGQNNEKVILHCANQRELFITVKGWRHFLCRNITVSCRGRSETTVPPPATDHCTEPILIISKHKFSRTDKRQLDWPTRDFQLITLHWLHLRFKLRVKCVASGYKSSKTMYEATGESADTPHIYFAANQIRSSLAVATRAPIINICYYQNKVKPGWDPHWCFK